MPLPQHITTGFEFDEAIWLAELCQRAHELFTHESETETQTLYDALYSDAEWSFVHAVSAGSARALIVQRSDRQQYALVFWMPESARRNTEQQSKSTAQVDAADVQDIPVTRGAGREEPHGNSTQPNRSESAAYPPLPNEVMPPSLGMRVYREWLEAFAACQEDVEHFFSERVSTKTAGACSNEPTELEIYISGHGAGGCLAALCALYLKRSWESRLDFPFFNLKMINFGSPKLGNKAFVDYYATHLKGYSYRVQNLLDGATYEPSQSVPFLYNLQLRLPGVDYVRDGDTYYMTYEHVGEPYLLGGIGTSSSDYHFRGPLSSTAIVPFAHSAAGYKQMLIETRKLRETYWKPVQRLAASVKKQRSQVIGAFQKQKAEAQKAVEEAVEEVQIKVTK